MTDEIQLTHQQGAALDALMYAIEMGERTALLVGTAGCLAGDTEIILNRAGKGFRLRISEVVRRFNGGVAGGKTWREDIPTRAQLRGEDGYGHLGIVVQAVESGVQETFRVVTSTGRSVRATGAHPFFTDTGWVLLRDLRPGALVCTLNPAETTVRGAKNKYLATQIARHPYAGITRYQGLRDDRATPRTRLQRRVPTHRLIAEARLSGVSYPEFLRRVRAGEHEGLVFLDPAVHQVHHINENSLDNSEANLQVLLVTDHHRHHARQSYQHVLWREAYEEVVAIEATGAEMTYDLCLAKEPHNFTANGFVVHNSGKTTLMRTLIARLEETERVVRLVAPTGKAALRLSEVTGRDATTIHAPLYGRARELPGGGIEFGAPKAITNKKHQTVVLLDEASMLSRQVLDDLLSKMPQKTQLVMFGDREQLKPVNAEWGADFDHPTCELTEIHRQALDNPILALSDGIRRGWSWWNFPPTDDPRYRYAATTIDRAIDWYVERRTDDAVLLTYYNGTRQQINRAVRERLKRTKPVQKGDRLVCRRNSKIGIYNGEVLEVAHVTDAAHRASVRFTNGAVARIFPQYLGLAGGGGYDALKEVPRESRDEFLLMEYGECLTIHVSQGSQWKSVGIVHDFKSTIVRDADTYRRLMYTAVTRAQHELAMFDVP